MRAWGFHDQKPCRSRGVQRPGEHHLDDLAPLLKRLAPVLDNLGHLTTTRLAFWQAGEGAWRPPVANGSLQPPWPPEEGVVGHGARQARFLPLPGLAGLWIMVESSSAGAPPAFASDLASVVARLVSGPHQTETLTEELGQRVEEVNLLYGISEVFGRTVTVEDAASVIVREVSAVVGARRASIMVHDEGTGTLRTVAARGFALTGLQPVPIDDPHSVAARVFREQTVLVGAPSRPDLVGERQYAEEPYLSVPIRFRPPGGDYQCVGVINLTEREGGGAFLFRHRRLVEAIATQIGVAIEQARQVVRDRAQQRLQHELAMARDLQRKLLPLPDALRGDAEVAVLFDPVESVGGDFYTFSRLGDGCVSVMLGDVSSHGLSAALVMAVVLATAGIHAPGSITPEETLGAMGASLAQKLTSTDSYLTVFHGVLDPARRRLTYASAGHPHAFRIPREGAPSRLETTAPPLGLVEGAAITSRQVEWVPGEDLLCLWTDGLVDASSEEGESFGEARVLAQLVASRAEHPDEVLRRVLADADQHATSPADDRTLLVLRI